MLIILNNFNISISYGVVPRLPSANSHLTQVSKSAGGNTAGLAPFPTRRSRPGHPSESCYFHIGQSSLSLSLSFTNPDT